MMQWDKVKATLAILFVGGILAGTIIAAMRSLLPRWTVLAILPYSPPMLILEGLVVVHIAFWLRPLTFGYWALNGLVLGVLAQSAAFIPYDLHSLLPYHWSAMITVPAALVGMALGER